MSSAHDPSRGSRPSVHAIPMDPPTPLSRRRMSSDLEAKRAEKNRDKEKEREKRASNGRTDYFNDSDSNDDRLARRRGRDYSRRRTSYDSSSQCYGVSRVWCMFMGVILLLMAVWIWHPSTFTQVAHHVQLARDFKQWNKPDAAAGSMGQAQGHAAGGEEPHLTQESLRTISRVAIATGTDSASRDDSSLQAEIQRLQHTIAEQHANLASAEHMIHDLTQKLQSCQSSVDTCVAAATASTEAPAPSTPAPAVETTKCICPICTSSCDRAVGAMPAPPPDAFYTSPKDHEKTWLYCPNKSQRHRDVLQFCPTTPTSEQQYQLSFYDQWNSKGELVPMQVQPSPPSCIQLPPDDYVWPVKHPQIPAPLGSSGTHWHNLRVSQLDDLRIFNPSAHKNLYHFDAPRYDLEFQKNIEFGEKYIPLASKIRLALDVGSGGGSFGIWLKHKFDIQSLSIAFPDWPYCEYIAERGNLCAYFDAFHAFPFAKFTFDLVHVSWVYHSMEVAELEVCFKELYRLTRPGGYLWMSDGWSNAQVAMMDELIQILGLVILYDHRVGHQKETYFGKQPYEVQWWTILLKPISAALDPACDPSNAAAVADAAPAASAASAAPAAPAASAASSTIAAQHAQPVVTDQQLPPIKPVSVGSLNTNGNTQPRLQAQAPAQAQQANDAQVNEDGLIN